ncbi:quinone-dependent dihydroorotate dehydrogenase [Streptomyces marincola]|uniref:quinone-dependent dihydroorotate dehydrogenase n=1 Tax=Streptomyces marincola TaxID=2878388 RepID=UPI001CF33CD0|nr:quinone-dependent dihydroorotate dehydrogenase [Streptomyces marincola]UCM86789.1 quinone-dependent dihydroorotate dehydrogenase [Streptomyces marincola]
MSDVPAYQLLFDKVLRRVDAERAHHLAFGLIRAAARVPGARGAVRTAYAPSHPSLRVHALGLDLPGPLGLAAGFDKNAVGVTGLAALGFDFVEIGTVTARPQPGNPAPRLFRLPADRALINRMGFNNDGSVAVAARLARLRAPRPVVGVNIGKNKSVPESEAVADYVTTTRRLARHADYLVVNVSSPNTPGLRDLQAADRLRPLLAAVREAADRSSPVRRVPLLVKIAPDLADEDIDAVADLAVETGLDGIVATNTTTGRAGLTTGAAAVEALGAGGLSGAPLKERSLAVLRRLYARAGDRLTLIGVGGIETADDAWQHILAGATLVQGYSGFVYGGPGWARDLHRGIAERLAASPYRSLAEAVGASAETGPAAARAPEESR